MKIASKIFKRDDWYITSKFGTRDIIKTKEGDSFAFHDGCDYGTNRCKWAQYAIENGIVLNCGVANDGAKYIWVNYPRINKKLLHYHLDSILVSKGQLVDENTILGYTGMTGKATGIHLHLGMKNSEGGEYQDPDAYNYQPISKKEVDAYQEYTVVKGDTLIKIAKKFNTTWKQIYENNKGVIGDNPNLIKIGQKLRI